jgi:hypothetical protein
MKLYQIVTAIPHDAIANILDLIAFVMVTPEIIGERRLSLLASWIRRIFGGENRTWLLVLSLFIASRIVRSLDVPRGFGHFLVVAGIAVLIAALFMRINSFVKTVPSRQLMLLLGAMLFVCARLIGIFVALQGA